MYCHVFEDLQSVSVIGSVNADYVPPALQERGTSRFTVVSHHPNVCRHLPIRVRPHLCQTLFTRYFLRFFTNDFQIFRYGDHGQDFDWIIFLWPWLNFEGYRGHYISKLTLFTQYFLQFSANGFQILRYDDHGPDLKLINFSRW